MVLFLNMCDIALAHLSTLPIDSSLRRSNRSLQSPVPTSQQQPPGQHTRVAEPERGCIQRQPPCHRWLYRDFPVFTAPLMAPDGAHKTRVPSCDDPAQVPGRKMCPKACIVQPQSGDTAAGGVCLIGRVPQLRAAAMGRNVAGGISRA